MRHRKHTFKIGRTGAHRRALLANMACSLICEGQIRTTVTKAKELRRYAEKLVTLAKKGTLHHRRQAIAKIKDKDAVSLLFSELAEQFANREGGYTRIIRLSKRRQGDAAEMCLIQWVEAEVAVTAKAAKEDAVVAEEAPVEEPKAEEAVEETAEEEK